MSMSARPLWASASAKSKHTEEIPCKEGKRKDQHNCMSSRSPLNRSLVDRFAPTMHWWCGFATLPIPGQIPTGTGAVDFFMSINAVNAKPTRATSRETAAESQCPQQEP